MWDDMGPMQFHVSRVMSDWFPYFLDLESVGNIASLSKKNIQSHETFTDVNLQATNATAAWLEMYGTYNPSLGAESKSWINACKCWRFELLGA